MAMGYYFISALIMFACILPKVSSKAWPSAKARETFKVRISEGSAKFYETIEIDEENGIEYFTVPPHNGLSETDRMYDFKMNITVSREKDNGICHITPLPEDMPRPNVMARGLKKMTHRPPTHEIVKVSLQWGLGPRVEKTSLRPEVQEFCGDFPVYRLEPFTPDSVTVVSEDGDNTRAERIRRNPTVRFCDLGQFPLCDTSKWIVSCRVTTSSCVYYVPCKSGQGNELIECDQLSYQHRSDSRFCCLVTCKTK